LREVKSIIILCQKVGGQVTLLDLPPTRKVGGRSTTLDPRSLSAWLD